MYGPAVVGASSVMGSVAVLPNTGGNSVVAAVAVTTLLLGVSLTAFAISKIIASKLFHNA